MSTAYDINKEIYEKNYSRRLVSSPWRRWLHSLISDVLDSIPYLSQNTEILDVGCGNGDKTYLVHQKFPNSKTLGIDYTKAGIDSANTNYGSRSLCFLCTDAQDISIWEKQYELITCFEVLEHLDDWKEVVDKICNNSKKYVLMSFPTGKMRKYEVNFGHVRNFKKGEMEGYLSQRGFRPVKLYYSGFPFLNPIGKTVMALAFPLVRNMKSKELEKTRKNSPPPFTTSLYSRIVYFILNKCSTKKNFGNQFVGLFINQTP